MPCAYDTDRGQEVEMVWQAVTCLTWSLMWPFQRAGPCRYGSLARAGALDPRGTTSFWNWWYDKRGFRVVQQYLGKYRHHMVTLAKVLYVR